MSLLLSSREKTPNTERNMEAERLIFNGSKHVEKILENTCLASRHFPLCFNLSVLYESGRPGPFFRTSIVPRDPKHLSVSLHLRRAYTPSHPM